MAAINAALLTFLSAGDHLICSRSLFGTTMGLLNNHIAASASKSARFAN